MVRKLFLYASVFGKVSFLLRDDFNDTLTAGNVHGTPATPGPGTRKVIDTNDRLSIGSGVMTMSGLMAVGDVYSLGAVTRAAGLIGMWVYGATRTIPSGVQVGFDTLEEATQKLHGFNTTGDAVSVKDGSSVPVTVTQAGRVNVAVVLRSTGAYYFMKVSDTWTLLWVGIKFSDATLYFRSLFSANTYNYTLDEFRLPKETWLPSPLAYTLFAGANGTSLDALDTLTAGPESQGCTARTWTEESGDWDIQSNKANPDGAGIATVDAGQADVIADLTVDGGTAGQPAICLRFTDTSNYWFLQADRANNQFELHEYNATVDTVRANAAVVFNDSTDYALRAICNGQTIDGWANSLNKISYGSAALNETETEHGLYADHTECEFDDFLVFARDIGYSRLNKFSS